MHFVEAPNNFYLGARVDPGTHTIQRDDVVYYDARDLTTHGVILGMTGSGKTGLAISLLEEAVLDGIPTIIVDPKGDITNMLLAFPEQNGEHFKPWISAHDAQRDESSVDEMAETVAQRWKAGLAEWGIDNDRIQDFRRAARFSIYTPGSEAGLQVSILQSFKAPREGWQGHEETMRERISGIVTAVLALIGINAKPVEDKEHVLLSNIFEHNWRNGVDLSMEQLIVQVQRPPFDKMGALDLEMVFPEKDRFKLAQLLNNIIAAPNFKSWIQGEPLDIPSMLYTPDGIPRCTILYTAHLNDSERQFFITLLMNTINSWMRTLSGSTSLRALVYMDEVFGMFPPHPHNPPTKDPIMRMLKQARAFGVGMIVATQNPKDIDYKGLSNIGTWFIGKLQTDNDKSRVLEGLDSARDAGSTLNINEIDRLIGQLNPREFIYHNVHDPSTPLLMRTRWAMSYLSGPMTREQIQRLMANQREVQAAHVQQQSAQDRQGRQQLPNQVAPGMAGMGSGSGPAQIHRAEPAAAPAAHVQDTGLEPPPGFSISKAITSTSVKEFYLPVEFTPQMAVRSWEQWTRQPAMSFDGNTNLLYRPSLLSQAVVRFNDNKTNTFETYYYAFVVPNIPTVPYLDWMEYITDPFDPHALEAEPYQDAYFGDLPSEMGRGSGFKELQSNLADWIYHNVYLVAWYNPVLKMYSQAGVDQRDFMAQVQAAVREKRDSEVDAIAQRYDKRLATIEERYEKKARRLESEQDELRARKQEELLTAGESLMQLMKGRAYYTLSRTSRMRRYTEGSQAQLGSIEEDLQDIVDDFKRTEAEFEQALQSVDNKWRDTLQQTEEVRISTYKKDINLMVFGVGWVPYWQATINGATTILPASSSGLSMAQQPDIGTGYYGGVDTYGGGQDQGGYDDGGGYRPSRGRAGRGY